MAIKDERDDEMYRVLLVDDEKLDLEGMQKLVDWKSFKLEVVDAVGTPYEALRVIGEKHVDIVLSDISMPLMSGLEMARKAKEIQPSLQFIFVSGYQDFQYAKQAIDMNACGYVLKPVDDSELENAFRKAVRHLDDTRTALPMLRGKRLYDWLEMNEPTGALPEPIEGSQLVAAIIELDDVRWKLNAKSAGGQHDILSRMNDEIWKLLEQWGIGLCAQTDASRIVVILTDEQALKHIENLPRVISELKLLTVTVGIGTLAATPSELPVSYRKAKEALSYKMFYGKDKSIHYRENKQGLVREAGDLNDILKDLFAAMSNYGLVKIDDCLNQMFRKAEEWGDRLTVYPFSLYILNRLDQYLESLNEDLFGMMNWEWQDMNILMQFETIQDIKSWLRKVLFTLSELLHNKKQNKNYKLIAQMEDYIESRLEVGLHFQELADHLAFTPNYLRHLFKKETGENVSDYINRRKMERAAELLKQDGIRVYEIADRLGYSTITLFNRHFKDAYGVTPREYRMQSQVQP